MPLYDCMLLLKPNVKSELLMDLVQRIGKHVYRRNGVLTDVKSFGNVQLGYGIKKLDGRYYQGQLMQLTMMTPPSFNNELYYLNKEDRLLRWLLIKHREMKFGSDFFDMDDVKEETISSTGSLYDRENDEEDDNDEDDDHDADDEYEPEQQPDSKLV
ncbi:uncharacterized protein LOC127251485 [Andrographis paniculata]|uniref:uncharacterized protein LOC127251485 n=1 Tax=Andrographis paniculata TaxID=175694 RepID=UPI0021E796B0|nr:uncharacterized protein LOC127251485 [Andrographis paniculata]XP_051131160.1 uncharacterized protein LOC127251485 [Andrographis paniculata]